MLIKIKNIRARPIFADLLKETLDGLLPCKSYVLETIKGTPEKFKADFHFFVDSESYGVQLTYSRKKKFCKKFPTGFCLCVLIRAKYI